MAVGELVETLRGESVDLLDGGQLTGQVLELRQALDLLEVEWERRVAELDQRRIVQQEGYTSTTAFLTHRARMRSGRAHRAVCQARRWASIPGTWKAVTEGNLSLDQARQVGKLPERVHDDLALHEPGLVEAIEELSVRDTEVVLHYWLSAVDGPGVEQDTNSLYQRRFLHVSKTIDGMVAIDGLLDPENGEHLLTALRAATPPPTPEDHRSAGQRRADTLCELAGYYLTHPNAGSSKPHLMVHVDLAALNGEMGGLHETGDGLILTQSQIDRIACDANVTRIVFGPGNQPVNLGRTTRTVPAHLARAVIARDRHCTHPGCERPPSWCDIHHLKPWAKGGETNLDDLTLRCRPHHTWIHQQE